MYQKIAPFPAPLVTAIALSFLPGTVLAGHVGYEQINLVSEIPGEAAVTDPNLLNPWGMPNSATSPFGVSDQGANVSTVLNSAGAGNFLDGGVPASFIFGTLAGSIYAWNGGNGTTAQAMAPTAGASFTGLALANNGAANFLYAANDTLSGGINVFNSSFGPVTLAGNFTDLPLPAGYVPYNIQNVGGKFYVEYTNSADPRAPGSGAVAVFDANGNFLAQLIGPGNQLHDPWGIVMAPVSFGTFSKGLLTGNLGNGEITAF